MRVCLSLCFVLLASSASAQRLEWSSEWRDPGAADAASAGALFLGSFALALGGEASATSWSHAGPLDAAATRTFGLRSTRGRRRASVASYVFGGLTLAMPISDSLVALGDNAEVAANLAQITTLSLASATMVTTFLKYVVLRARPDAEECQSEECATSRYRGFPSGHSSLAFTAASLSCTYHLRVGIYGSRAADIAACGTSLAFAFTTSILRMVARRHYLSDVLVGGALGVLAGWVLPSLLYLGFGD